MKVWLSALAAFLLTACTAATAAVNQPDAEQAGSRTSAEAPLPSATLPPLPDLGPAPELTNEVWLNTEAPLRLADLRGRVILLEMWTYG